MTKDDLILIGLASLQASQTQDTVANVLAEWKRLAENLLPKSKRAKAVTVDENAVEEIYGAYPPYDTLNDNRSTNKGRQSKNLIRHLLVGGVSKEELLELIKDRVARNEYLPNFNTFLRNLPCKEDYQKQTQQATDSFHF